MVTDKKQKIVVLGIIENDSGNILIAQRSDPKIPEAHLKWDVPGGTNEFGESLEETLEREILEETGLKVEINEFMPKYSSVSWKHEEYDLHNLVFCYSCKLIGGTLGFDDPKINDLKWIDPCELQNFDFLPTTRDFIHEFLKRR